MNDTLVWNALSIFTALAGGISMMISTRYPEGQRLGIFFILVAIFLKSWGS